MSGRVPLAAGRADHPAMAIGACSGRWRDEALAAAGIEQITAAGQTRHYHHDHLGSTRALTDQDGQAVATYTYSPYGAEKTSTGSVTNPFRYAGQYTDPTGLQHLHARYYDPTTATFVTPDPIVSLTREPYDFRGTEAWPKLGGADFVRLRGELARNLRPCADERDYVIASGTSWVSC